jgi:hypothetical protein
MQIATGVREYCVDTFVTDTGSGVLVTMTDVGAGAAKAELPAKRIRKRVIALRPKQIRLLLMAAAPLFELRQFPPARTDLARCFRRTRT